MEISNEQSRADEGWSSRSDVMVGTINTHCKETPSSEMLKNILRLSKLLVVI